MNIKDVNLIRAFSSVAKFGSFSEAARQLSCSQPTLTRQIQSLEQQTGLHLFERSNKGLRLTEAGMRLVESSNRLMLNLDNFNRVAAGQENQLEGDVRISANEIIGYYLLPNALAALREKYPSIQIELEINNNFTSLTRRDADIAFRMAKPSQQDLVGRKLPQLPIGIYASQKLIAKEGAPNSLEQLLQLPLIGFDNNRMLIDAFLRMGIEAKQHHFDVRTDSLLSQITLARAGAGFCIMQQSLAKQFPELVPVLEEESLPKLPFWLVCHSDIQYSRKIRAVMIFLGDWFSEDVYARAIL